MDQFVAFIQKSMIFTTASIRLTISLVCIFVVGSACTTMTNTKNPSFDPTQVSGMEFELKKPIDLLGVSLPLQDISKQVSENLAQWGYPFVIDNNQDSHSHNLILDIGSIKHGSTPVGFSFSSGNSDPRSLDFQKADVLPIVCSLAPKSQPEQRAELTMEVMADDYLPQSKQTDGQSKLVARLIDDISTTCFNLLSSLNVKTLPQSDTAIRKQPTWIPEIRVEIENDVDTNHSVEVDNNIESDKPETLPAVEKNIKNTSPRKRIIIHNQGSPVIFKFGHERK